MNRNVAAYAGKQMVEKAQPGKIRLRVGNPLTAASVGVCTLAANLPAFADAGKLFDFDLTLPYMASEILLLSFFLDKMWFGPLGKVIDDRNAMMKSTMDFADSGVDECESMVSFAENALLDLERTLRSEREEKLSALTAECDAAIASTQEKVNKEIEDAFTGIEKDRTIVLSSLTGEIETFCWEILDKVLPEGEATNWKKSEAKLFNKVAA
eukprot:CAMPEP_0167751900 /NCGR_PEP_ID=MMETSP0110_2-20121227/6833_1 /TAXON_ID=629695 /ORGANISM="Gymnochlora sp., Strain CCMP2014" /LENGTH=210 /DNA_ID=CAMNT_0007637443 /DNA_START=182 /DNA_END=814 /DNA_ORIENTATION=+